jgi:hypothetical protein
MLPSVAKINTNSAALKPGWPLSRCWLGLRWRCCAALAALRCSGPFRVAGGRLGQLVHGRDRRHALNERFFKVRVVVGNLIAFSASQRGLTPGTCTSSG